VCITVTCVMYSRSLAHVRALSQKKNSIPKTRDIGLSYSTGDNNTPTRLHSIWALLSTLRLVHNTRQYRVSTKEVYSFKIIQKSNRRS
jgi:hypothetical protein